MTWSRLFLQNERPRDIDLHLVTFDAENIYDVLHYIQSHVLTGTCKLSDLYADIVSQVTCEQSDLYADMQAKWPVCWHVC